MSSFYVTFSNHIVPPTEPLKPESGPYSGIYAFEILEKGRVRLNFENSPVTYWETVQDVLKYHGFREVEVFSNRDDALTEFSNGTITLFIGIASFAKSHILSDSDAADEFLRNLDGDLP